jgi:glycosyltransferase involved in cell wall biosynthesis
MKLELSTLGLHPPESTLVSIGVPTFNRPKLLARALEHLLNQTWRDIEIVVSDNASTDPEVQKIISSYAEKDERIRAFRQPSNLGSLNNFFFVLKEAKAPYFMWAADDDYIAPWFVERALRTLWGNPALSMASAEAQYMTEDGHLLPFIAEGEAFRTQQTATPMDRLLHMVECNFGNLVYGLFRKEALLQDGEVFWQKSGLHSLNEIPPLLYAAFVGGLTIDPEVGLYKQVPAAVHAQVEWELKGGRLPEKSRMSGWRSVRATWDYHAQSLRHISSALNLLPIKSEEKERLRRAAWCKLLKHFTYMVLGYRPKLYS